MEYPKMSADRELERNLERARAWLGMRNLSRRDLVRFLGGVGGLAALNAYIDACTGAAPAPPAPAPAAPTTAAPPAASPVAAAPAPAASPGAAPPAATSPSPVGAAAGGPAVRG